MTGAQSKKWHPARRPKLFIIAITVIAAATLAGMVLRNRVTSRGAGPIALASGRFHQVAHKGSGVATVYELPGGKRVLSLTDFCTASSPDLQVYLINAPDALENETVEKSEQLLLGELQKAEGDQSYPLPDDLDLTRYRAVVIWNRKYRVNFTTAPLAPR